MTLAVGFLWLVIAIVIGVRDVKKGRAESVAYVPALIISNIWFAAAWIK